MTPALYNSKRVALEILRCEYKSREYLSALQWLSDQAKLYEATGGEKGIPSKKIGGKRLFWVSYFEQDGDQVMQRLEREYSK